MTRVLIAEDNAVNRELLREFWRRVDTRSLKRATARGAAHD